MATVRQRCQGAFLRVCGPRSVIGCCNESTTSCVPRTMTMRADDPTVAQGARDARARGSR